MPVDEALYPVNLRLEGRRCLVVGGGSVAATKVAGLLECGAGVHVVAPRIDDALRTDDRVTTEVRSYRRGEVAGYRIAIAATDDPAVNHAVYEDGEAHGVLVNSADDPANCAFTLPSRIRQGDLLVTFATGGHSPALATWLRRRFTEEFGPEYQELIDILASEREALRAGGRSTEGLDWQSALDSGMLDLVRQHRIDEAKELLRRCLSR